MSRLSLYSTLVASAVVLVLLVGFGISRATEPYMVLTPPVTVSAANSASPEQAWAHADPANARNLIVCGDERIPANNLFSGYLYTSADGGVTWRQTLFEHSTMFVSEESCAYGSHDAAYFIAGASNYYNGEPHHETGHMHFYASNDGGRTWARTWTRADGWLDWTSIANSPRSNGRPDATIVFANSGTDKLGHWSKWRPVAIESDNGGRSFTGLVSPHPSDFRYVSVWTGENTVLPDGTVLFATSAAHGPIGGKYHGWANGQVAVEVFAYDPVHHQVTSRAVLRMRHNVPIFTAAIAQDRSSGHFSRRLYAAWVEGTAKASALWLATSDDEGYHWRSRPVLQGRGFDFPADCPSDQPVDQVELATTPNGTLGIAWLQNGSNVRFATSHDGGTTFSSPVVLTQADTSGLYVNEAITWNDYWLDTDLTIQRGQPSPQGAWANILGLGIVVRTNRIFDLSLVGSGDGRFHTFWVAPQGSGHVLMTRSISVGAAASSGSALLGTPAAAACSTQSAAALAHPVLPQALPSISIAGYRDVTGSVALNPVHYTYDSSTHVATIDSVIVNKGKTTLHAPLTIVAVNPHSDVGQAKVINATGSSARQPSWDVSALIPAAGLAPGAQSKPLHVVVAISGFRPFPSNYLSGDVFSMAIRAFTRR